MPNLEEDLQTLRDFHEELWVTRYVRSRGQVRAPAQIRITEKDFTKIVEIVLRWDLPTRMISTQFGFGVGIVIHEPEPPPLYPGIVNDPAPLLEVTQDHLPESMAISDLGRITFDDGFRVFSEITHSHRNKAILRRCGFREPQPKGYYDY